MGSAGNLRFGIDMITLYDPPMWGIDDFNKFYDKSVLTPDVFWDRALDVVADAGLDGIEITFGPSNWRNALEYYGSAAAFQGAVTKRDLVVCSGFFTGLVLDGDWRDPDRQKAIYQEVAEYADFLRDSGCEIMVAGLPIRTTWDAEPPLFIDHEYANGLARVINQMGYITAKRGVKLNIHPETHAVLWFRRDIDLFLSLTDPVYVGFCPDTAHITTGGGNPSEILRAHSERITITHWKDAVGQVPVKMTLDENVFKSHHPYFARVGLGIVDWQEWVRTLREVKFDGWAIIELDAAANPPATIAAAKSFVDTALLPIYS